MPGGVSYIGDLSVVETGGEITSASVGDKALKSACSDNVSLEVDSSTGKLQISYATLIDALNVNSATGAYGNIKNKGSGGEESELWGTSKYITASLTCEAGSLAGFYAVHVIDLNS